MSTLFFDFSTIGQSWDMGLACDNPSSNPAIDTIPCVYLIHNSNSNNTYAGYAENAKNRWKTRSETFHCMGIEEAYAKNILCAVCVPCDQHGNQYMGLIKGANSPEHFLIRAIRLGVLGATTCTNTQLRELPAIAQGGITHVEVQLPTDPWGKLESNRIFNIPAHGSM